ncbi:MAG TPA: MBL fold metallo-hydrolase [Geobacteraceae bacterium]|nr:MBL fold metallo-hydrolase [Geobacteraceae bacterium]
MIVETVVVGPLMVNCYVLGCEQTREGLVIDPGGDVEDIFSVISHHQLKILTVINTHGHFDHMGGNNAVVSMCGSGLLIHELDAPMLARADLTAQKFGLTVEASSPPTGFLHEGDTVSFGNYKLSVLHTPGHSPGSCSLFGEGVVFTGDTLFAESVGRTDFPGGSSSALGKSIREKLLILPDETVVYPGHGPSTTIGHEKLHNPYLTR